MKPMNRMMTVSVSPSPSVPRGRSRASQRPSGAAGMPVWAGASISRSLIGRYS